MWQNLFKLFLSFFFVLYLFVSSSFLVYANHIPTPTGFVNDFAHVLTPAQKDDLENHLSQYEKQTGNEIAVAIVTNLNGGDINDFSSKTFEEWKIGKKDKDNGLLFLAAIEDKKMRIEVGYGLEPNITDSQAGEIIRNTIAPEFKNGSYYLGITRGIDQIEKQIGNPQTNAPTDSPSESASKGWGSLIVVFAIPMITYLSSFLARSKSFWMGGLIGGIIGFFVGHSLGSIGTIIGWVVIIGGLGLLLDFVLSRNYQVRKKSGMSTGFMSSMGGFSTGRGFGGFGGGRSGGGGASGGW